MLIWRSYKSCLFFESFTSDSSILKKSLLRKSSRSCFCFCRKFSMFYLFIHLLTLLTFYFVLLWENSWFEEVKSLLFYWFVEKWLFFSVIASFWFNTITHLFSTFCDSLSNDKYERERVTVQLRKNVQSQEEESNVTISQKQMWQYRFEEAYCTVVNYSSNESATMTYL